MGGFIGLGVIEVFLFLFLFFYKFIPVRGCEDIYQ
jgi:hypothetical protein